jgi:hypothetical protein
MEEQEMRLEMNYRITVAATVLCLLLAFALTAQAQQGGDTAEQGEVERRLLDRMFESDQLEENRLLLMMAERFHKSSRSTRSPRLLLAQIREDYVRLQVVNNDLVQAVVTSNTLDLKLIAQSTAEIKRLAERLKHNLLLPETETCNEPHKVIVGPEVKHLRAALAALDIMIVRMVRNPLFRNPNLFDPHFASQVGCDLEAIIELSALLKKRSEHLYKEEHRS